MLALGALAAAVTFAAPARAADPAPVIAAERAFAARAAEIGLGPSFLEFMAADAIVFSPDPTSARALYGAQPKPKTPKEGGRLYAWWPSWAGLAASGDLGFTTGPVEVNGKRAATYFTVWKKQADGSWKWVLDGGTSSNAAKAPGPNAPVFTLGPAAASPLAPAKAMAEVKLAEAALAAGAQTDQAQAYQQALSSVAHVQGSAAPPAVTPSAVAVELATRPKAIDFTPLGGDVSKAGDLAWTYGAARWLGGRGHYVRIWRREAAGWRIVFDEIIDVPPPRNA